jgi:hypothetical protein
MRGAPSCAPHPSPSNLACPIIVRHAPRTDTGSRDDQIASRGSGSPLWRAVSASLRRLCVNAMKSSVSVTVTVPLSCVPRTDALVLRATLEVLSPLRR